MGYEKNDATAHGFRSTASMILNDKGYDPGVIESALGPKGAELPVLGGKGLTHWPGGSENWHRPVFTVRRMAADASWIDVDIALHDSGRVTQWCAGVEPGQEIGMTGPGGGKLPDAPQVHLFGDETALPVILRMIEDMSVDPTGTATISIRDPVDAQTMDFDSGINLRWIDMKERFDKERIHQFHTSYVTLGEWKRTYRLHHSQLLKRLEAANVSPIRDPKKLRCQVFDRFEALRELS